VKTHCKRGHKFTEENTYVSPSNGGRNCRTCLRAYRKLHPKTKDQNQRYADKVLYSGKREAVIARDGGKCVQCGMTREEHRKRWRVDLTIDHIDRKGHGVPKELKNNNMSNLQTLCRSCHGRKDNEYRKLTDNQVVNIIHMRKELSQGAIARLYGVTPETIHYIVRGKWRKDITGHLSEEFEKNMAELKAYKKKLGL